MEFLIAHSSLEFDFSALIALIVLIAVIAVFAVRRHRMVRERDELKEQLNGSGNPDGTEES